MCDVFEYFNMFFLWAIAKLYSFVNQIFILERCCNMNMFFFRLYFSYISLGSTNIYNVTHILSKCSSC